MGGSPSAPAAPPAPPEERKIHLVRLITLLRGHRSLAGLAGFAKPPESVNFAPCRQYAAKAKHFAIGAPTEAAQPTAVPLAALIRGAEGVEVAHWALLTPLQYRSLRAVVQQRLAR